MQNVLFFDTLHFHAGRFDDVSVGVDACSTDKAVAGHVPHRPVRRVRITPEAREPRGCEGWNTATRKHIEIKKTGFTKKRRNR